jgi:uracil-DNA glycosylase family 4
MIIVPAYGPTSSGVLLVGKAPGLAELTTLRPFSGRAGSEQQAYLRHHGLSQYAFRLTNLVGEYVDPDTDLTTDQIDLWSPILQAEIDATRPRLIVAIGAQPVRWFLGDDADLHTVHGLPHRPGAFDPSRTSRAPGDCCILPVIQPAAGFYDPDARAVVAEDFARLARVYKLIRTGRAHEVDYREDPLAGREQYVDISGHDLASLLSFATPDVIAIDTEGTPTDPWSLQVSWQPGTAYLLRCAREDFHEAIATLAHMAERGVTIVLHNAMYDLTMLRLVGLDLYFANIFDTMMAAYFFQLEPLGLKPLSWRWLGVRMKSHEETVGALGKQFQIDYLTRALDLSRDWPKPSPQILTENDGTMRVYRPQPIAKRIASILADVASGKVDGEGNLADPWSRWRDVDKLLRRPVEEALGPMPVGSMARLAEMDFDAALRYSCKDSDVTLRLYPLFRRELERRGMLASPTQTTMTNLAVFDRMQWNGLPARRSKLSTLRDQMEQGMWRIGAQLAHEYNGGQPFNPKSPPQTLALLKRLGLKGSKRTKSGAESTGKKSIEHLKFHEDEHSRRAVVLLFEWREHQHTRDMFCTPTLDTMPEDGAVAVAVAGTGSADIDDLYPVRCRLQPWGTHTRRLASKEPNLLAQPKHSIYGKMIRDCYEAPPGYVFLESDLSAIEVCVMAHESGDPTLIRLLSTPGIKFHRETACRIWDIPPEEVDEIKYYVAKRIIFLTFYGGGGETLKEQLWMQGLTSWRADECQDLIDMTVSKVYPGIAEYKARVADEVARDPAGEVRDMWNMPRFLPGIHSSDRKIREEAIRHAVSHKIQGGAQGMLQNSIAWLKYEIPKLAEMGAGIGLEDWRLTVHDSLLLTCEEWAVPIVQPVVERGLTEHHGARLRVPVRAESKTARSWGAL